MSNRTKGLIAKNADAAYAGVLAGQKSALERRIVELESLVRRAGPFVNAVAVMADDRSKALGWLADAGASVGTLSTFDPGLEARNV